ncbi:Myb domain [Phytophthora cactorum]|nr:Myb domain [Phytophthora cactorum]
MRSARLAAREIEWCGAKLISPAKPRGVMKKSGIWSRDEHERYCEALEMYRYGSWKQIADHVGSRTERQVLSHAQSIRARKKKDEERRGSTISSRLSLLEARKATPEELLAASMKVPASINRHPSLTTVLRSSALGLEFRSRFIVYSGFDAKVPVVTNTVRAHEETTNDGEGEDYQRSIKRSRPNPNASVSVSFDAPLNSLPLEILLEGVLSEEDLLELLEIQSPRSEVELASDCQLNIPETPLNVNG